MGIPPLPLFRRRGDPVPGELDALRQGCLKGQRHEPAAVICFGMEVVTAGDPDGHKESAVVRFVWRHTMAALTGSLRDGPEMMGGGGMGGA